MKSKLKWVSGILGAVLALSLMFGAGVYANEKGWLTFKDEQVTQADDNLEAIMEILRQVNEGKKIATSDLEAAQTKLNELQAELDDLPPDTTPKGLAEQNQKLRKQVTDLESQLKTANGTITLRDNTIEGLNVTIDKHETTIADKDTTIKQWSEKYSVLEQEVSRLQEDLTAAISDRDTAITDLENANELNEQNKTNLALAEEKVNHLEAELIKANEAVTSHNTKTEEALTKAQGYVDQE